MKCNHIWTEILDPVYRTGYENHAITEFQENLLVSFITWQVAVRYRNPLVPFTDPKIVERFWGD